MEGLRLLLLLSGLLVTHAGPISQTTCAIDCPEGSDSLFPPGKTTTFRYSGHTLTNILGTKQEHAGVQINAHVHIDALSPCEYKLRLSDVQLHEVDSSDSKKTSESPNSAAFKEALEKQALHFAPQTNGEIRKVCAHNEDPVWIINIKRGVLSAIQHQKLTGSYSTQRSLIESDIHGDCPVVYHSIPSEEFQKSSWTRKLKNLTTCLNRETQSSALQSMSYNGEGSLPSQTQAMPLTLASYNCKHELKDGHLEMVFCEEKHMFRPFSRQSSGVATTIVQRLERTGDSDVVLTSTPFTNFRQTNLKFEPISTEDKRSGVKVGVLKTLEKLCSSVADDIRRETPEIFTELVYQLRLLTLEEFKAISSAVTNGHVCPKNSAFLRTHFFDAISFSGTPASIAVMMTAIKEEQIASSDIDLWLTGLPLQKAAPTVQVIEDLLPLITVPQPRKQALLGVSAILNRFCQGRSNCEDNTSVKTLEEALLQHINEDCSTASKSPKEISDMLVALKALGNAAIKMSATKLTSCALKSENPMSIRVAALQAFRRIPCSADRTGLFDILANKEHDAELRIHAYLGSMVCPSSKELFKVKDILETETVNQVGSFIWTHLTNLRETADPLKQTVRRILEDSRLRNEFDLEKLKFSRNVEKSIMLPWWNVGGQMESNLIWSQNSFVPRSASLNLTTELFGRSINFVNLDARVEGLEALLEKLLGPDGYLRQKKNSAKKSYSEMYTEALKKIEGSFGIQIFGQEIAFSDFAKGDLSNTMQYNLLDMILDMGKERQFQLTKSLLLMDSTISVPTTLGLPLVISINVSASTHIEAKGKYQLANILSWPPVFNVEGQLKPSAAVHMSGLVAIDTFYSSYGVKVTSTVHTSTEMGAIARFQNADDFHLELITPKEKQELASFSSDVYVVHRGGEKRQNVPEQEITKHIICSGEIYEKMFGAKACAKLSYPRVTTDIANSLTGPTEGSIFLIKTDQQTGYKIKGSLKSERNPTGITSRFFRLEVDTPLSNIRRNFLIDFVFDVSNRIFKTQIITPWKTALVEAALQNLDKSKRLAVRLQVDQEDFVRIEANHKRGEQVGDTLVDLTNIIVKIPQWEPITASWKMTTDAKGRNMDLIIDQLFNEKIKAKGTLRLMDTSNKLSMGERYILDADVESMYGQGTIKGTFQLTEFLKRIEVTLRHMDKDKKDLRPYIITFRHKFHDMSSSALQKGSLAAGISFGRNGDQFYRVIVDGESAERHLRTNYELQYGASGDGDATAFKEVVQGNIFGSHVQNDLTNVIKASVLFEVPNKEIRYAGSMSASLSKEQFETMLKLTTNSQDYLSISTFINDKSTSSLNYGAGMICIIPGKKVDISTELIESSPSTFDLTVTNKYNNELRGALKCEIIVNSKFDINFDGKLSYTDIKESLYDVSGKIYIQGSNNFEIIGNFKSASSQEEYFVRLIHDLETQYWNSEGIYHIVSGFTSKTPLGEIKMMARMIKEPYELLHEIEISLGDDNKYGFNTNFIFPQMSADKKELLLAAGFFYPGRTVNFNLNWIMEYLKMNSQIEFQWEENKSVSVHAMYELDDGWTQKGIIASITVKTPFEGYTQTHLGLNGLGQLRYRKLDIEYNWGNKKRIKLDITVIPKSSNDFDATIVLITPFTRMSYLGIHAKHRMTDVSLVTTARCDLGPNSRYAVSLELMDNSYNKINDFSGKFMAQAGNDPELNVEFNHKSGPSSAKSMIQIHFLPVVDISVGYNMQYMLKDGIYLETKGELFHIVTSDKTKTTQNNKISWSHVNSDKHVLTSLVAILDDIEHLSSSISGKYDTLNGLDCKIRFSTKVIGMDDMMTSLSFIENHDFTSKRLTVDLQLNDLMKYNVIYTEMSYADVKNFQLVVESPNLDKQIYLYTFSINTSNHPMILHSKLQIYEETYFEASGLFGMKFGNRRFLEYIPESIEIDLTLKPNLRHLPHKLNAKGSFALKAAEGNFNLQLVYGNNELFSAKTSVYTSNEIIVNMKVKSEYDAVRDLSVVFQLANNEGKFNFNHNNLNKISVQLLVQGLRVIRGFGKIDVKSLGSNSIKFNSEMTRNTIEQSLKMGNINYNLNVDWKNGVSFKSSINTACKYLESMDIAVNFDQMHQDSTLFSFTLSHKGFEAIHSVSGKLSYSNNLESINIYFKVNPNGIERKIEFQHTKANTNFDISCKSVQFHISHVATDKNGGHNFFKISLDTKFKLLKHFQLIFNQDGRGSSFKHSHSLRLKTLEHNYEIENKLEIVSFRYLNIESKLIFNRPIYSFAYSHFKKVNSLSVLLSITGAEFSLFNGEIKMAFTQRIMQVTVRFGQSESSKYVIVSFLQKFNTSWTDIKHSSEIKVLDYYIKNDIEWTSGKYLSANVTTSFPNIKFNGGVTVSKDILAVHCNINEKPTFRLELNQFKLLIFAPKFYFIRDGVIAKGNERSITVTTILKLDSELPTFKSEEYYSSKLSSYDITTGHHLRSSKTKLTFAVNSSSTNVRFSMDGEFLESSILINVNHHTNNLDSKINILVQAPKIDTINFSCDYTLAQKKTFTVQLEIPKYLSEKLTFSGSYLYNKNENNLEIFAKVNAPVNFLKNVLINFKVNLHQGRLFSSGELLVDKVLKKTSYNLNFSSEIGHLQVEVPNLNLGSLLANYTHNKHLGTITIKALADSGEIPWNMMVDIKKGSYIRMEQQSPLGNKNTLKLHVSPNPTNFPSIDLNIHSSPIITADLKLIPGHFKLFIDSNYLEGAPIKLSSEWIIYNGYLGPIIDQLQIAYTTPYTYLTTGVFDLKMSSGGPLTINTKINTGATDSIIFSFKLTPTNLKTEIMSPYVAINEASMEIEYTATLVKLEVKHNMLQEKIFFELKPTSIIFSAPYGMSKKITSLSVEMEKNLKIDISIPTETPFLFNVDIVFDNVVKANIFLKCFDYIPEVKFDASFNRDNLEEGKYSIDTGSYHLKGTYDRQQDGFQNFEFKLDTSDIYKLKISWINKPTQFVLKSEITTPFENLLSAKILYDASYKDDKFDFKAVLNHDKLGDFSTKFSVKFYNTYSMDVNAVVTTPFATFRENKVKFMLKEKSFSGKLITSALEDEIEINANWEFIGKVAFILKIKTPFEKIKNTKLELHGSDYGVLQGKATLDQDSLGFMSASYSFKWPSPSDLEFDLECTTPFVSFEKNLIIFKTTKQLITMHIESSKFSNPIKFVITLPSTDSPMIKFDINTPISMLEKVSLTVDFLTKYSIGKVGFAFQSEKFGKMSKYVSWKMSGQKDLKFLLESRTPFEGYEKSSLSFEQNNSQFKGKIESSKLLEPIQFESNFEIFGQFDVRFMLTTPFEQVKRLNVITYLHYDSQTTAKVLLQHNDFGEFSVNFAKTQTDSGNTHITTEIITPFSEFKNAYIKFVIKKSNASFVFETSALKTPLKGTLEWKVNPGSYAASLSTNQNVLKTTKVVLTHNSDHLSANFEHNILGNVEFRLENKNNKLSLELKSTLFKKEIHLTSSGDINGFGFSGTLNVQTPFSYLEKVLLQVSALGSRTDFEFGVNCEHSRFGKFSHTTTWKKTSRNWYELKLNNKTPYGKSSALIEMRRDSIKGHFSCSKSAKPVIISAIWSKEDNLSLSASITSPFALLEDVKFNVELPSWPRLFSKYAVSFDMGTNNKWNAVHSCTQLSTGAVLCKSAIDSPIVKSDLSTEIQYDNNKFNFKLKFDNENTGRYELFLRHNKVNNQFVGEHGIITPNGKHQVKYNLDLVETQLIFQINCNHIGNWKLAVNRKSNDEVSLEINSPYRNLKVQIINQYPANFEIIYSDSKEVEFSTKLETFPSEIKFNYQSSKYHKMTYDLSLSFPIASLRQSSIEIEFSMNDQKGKLACFHNLNRNKLEFSCELNNNKIKHLPQSFKSTFKANLDVKSDNSGSASATFNFGLTETSFSAIWNNEKILIKALTPFEGYENNVITAELKASHLLDIEKLAIDIDVGSFAYSAGLKFVVNKNVQLKILLKNNVDTVNFNFLTTMESSGAMVKFLADINSQRFAEMNARLSSKFINNNLLFEAFFNFWVSGDILGDFELLQIINNIKFKANIDGFKKCDIEVSFESSNNNQKTKKVYTSKWSHSLINNGKQFNLELNANIFSNSWSLSFGFDKDNSGKILLMSPIQFLNIEGRYFYKIEAGQIKTKIDLKNDILGRYGIELDGELHEKANLVVTVTTPFLSKTFELSGSYKNNNNTVTLTTTLQLPQMKPIQFNLQITNDFYKKISFSIESPYELLHSVQFEGSFLLNNIHNFRINAFCSYYPHGKILNLDLESNFEKEEIRQRFVINVFQKQFGYSIVGLFTPLFIGKFDVYTPFNGMKQITLTGEKIDNSVEYKFDMEENNNAQLRLEQSESSDGNENNVKFIMPKGPVKELQIKYSRKRLRRSLDVLVQNKHFPINVNVEMEPKNSAFNGKVQVFSGSHKFQSSVSQLFKDDNEFSFEHSAEFGNKKMAVKWQFKKESGKLNGNLSLETPWKKLKTVHLKIDHNNNDEGLKFDHSLTYPYEGKDKRIRLHGKIMHSQQKTDSRVTFNSPFKYAKHVECKFTREQHSENHHSFNHHLTYAFGKTIRLHGEGKYTMNSIDGRITFNSPFKSLKHIEGKFSHLYSDEGKHTFKHRLTLSPSQVVRLFGDYHPTVKGIQGSLTLNTPLQKEQPFVHVKVFHHRSSNGKVKFHHSISYFPSRGIQCHGHYHFGDLSTTGSLNFKSHIPELENIIANYNHIRKGEKHIFHHSLHYGQNAKHTFSGLYYNPKHGIQADARLLSTIPYISHVEANLYHMQAENGKITYNHKYQYGPSLKYKMHGHVHLSKVGIKCNSTFEYLRKINIVLDHTNHLPNKWTFNHRVFYDSHPLYQLEGKYHQGNTGLEAFAQLQTPFNVIKHRELVLSHRTDSKGNVVSDYKYRENKEREFRILANYYQNMWNFKGKFELQTPLEKARKISLSMLHQLHNDGSLVFDHSLDYGSNEPLTLQGFVNIKHSILQTSAGKIEIKSSPTGNHHLTWNYYTSGSSFVAIGSSSHPTFKRIAIEVDLSKKPVMGFIWNQQSLNISQTEKYTSVNIETIYPDMKTFQVTIYHMIPEFKMLWVSGKKHHQVELQHKQIAQDHTLTLKTTYPSPNTATLAVITSVPKIDFEWENVRIVGTVDNKKEEFEVNVETSFPWIKKASLTITKSINPLQLKVSINKRKSSLSFEKTDSSLKGKFETDFAEINPILLQAKWSLDEVEQFLSVQCKYGYENFQMQIKASEKEFSLTTETPFNVLTKAIIHVTYKLSPAVYNVSGKFILNDWKLTSHLDVAITNRNNFQIKNRIDSNIPQLKYVLMECSLLNSLDKFLFYISNSLNDYQQVVFSLNYNYALNDFFILGKVPSSEISFAMSRNSDGKMVTKFYSNIGNKRFIGTTGGSDNTIDVDLETPFEFLRTIRMSFYHEQTGLSFRHKSNLKINSYQVYNFDADLTADMPNIDLIIRSPIAMQLTLTQNGLLYNGEMGFLVKYNSLTRGVSISWNLKDQISLDMLITTPVRKFKFSTRFITENASTLLKLSVNPNTKLGKGNEWRGELVTKESSSTFTSTEIVLVTPLRTLFGKVILDKTNYEVQFSWNHVPSNEHMVKLVYKQLNEDDLNNARVEVFMPRLRNPLVIQLSSVAIPSENKVKYVATMELSNRPEDHVTMSVVTRNRQGLNPEISLILSQKSSNLFISGTIGISRKPTYIKIYSYFKLNDLKGNTDVYSFSINNEVSPKSRLHQISFSSPKRSLEISITLVRTESGHKWTAEVIQNKNAKLAALVETDNVAPGILVRIYNDPQNLKGYVEFNAQYTTDREISLELFRQKGNEKISDVRAEIELKAEHLISASYYQNKKGISLPNYLLFQVNHMSYNMPDLKWITEEAVSIEKVLADRWNQLINQSPDIQEVVMYFNRERRLFKNDLYKMRLEYNRMVRRNEFYLQNFEVIRVAAVREIIDVITFTMRSVDRLMELIVESFDYMVQIATSVNYVINVIRKEISIVFRSIVQQLRNVLTEITDITLDIIEVIRQKIINYLNPVIICLENFKNASRTWIKKYVTHLLEPTMQWIYSKTVNILQYCYGMVGKMSIGNLSYLPYEVQLRQAITFVQNKLDKLIHVYSEKLRYSGREASKFFDKWIGLENMRTVIDITYDGTRKLHWLIENTYSEDFIRSLIRSEYLRILDAVKYSTYDAVINYFKLNSLHIQSHNTDESFAISGKMYIPLVMRDLKTIPEFPKLENALFSDIQNIIRIPEQLKLAGKLGWDIPSVFGTQGSWVPQFDSFGSLAGNHVITLDKEQFNLDGECTVLLAGREKWAIHLSHTPTKHLQINAHQKTIEMFSNYQIKVDGYLVELPYKTDSLSIVRIGPMIKLTDESLGFSVTGDIENDIYTIGVSGWHHGKVAGIFGNRDNEPFNDIRDKEGNKVTINQFVKAWTLTGTCLATKIEQKPKFPNFPCKFLFKCPVSPLSKCFKVVNPAPFLKMCESPKRDCPSCPVKRLCNAARAYASQCAKAKVQVRLPFICRKCVGSTAQKPSADVVIVAQPGCLTNDLGSIIRRMNTAFNLEGIHQVRWGLSVPGSHAYTVNNGQIMSENWMHISNALARIPQEVKSNENPFETADEAIKTYPWTGGASRHIVVLQCSSCSSPPTTLTQNLIKRNIKLHYLSKEKFSYSKLKTVKLVLGITSKRMYSQRHPAGLPVPNRRFRSAREICIQSALKSGGSAFNIENLVYPRSRSNRAIDIFSMQVASNSFSNQVTEKCNCQEEFAGEENISCPNKPLVKMSYRKERMFLNRSNPA